MDISQFISQYNSVEELKAFCQAQYKTIIELNKKIEKLEEEKEHIEKLLAKSVPIIEDPNNPSPITRIQGLSDEEAICVLELGKLKTYSLERELTLEECKKVDVYVKTLNSLHNRKVTDKNDIPIDNTELLKLLEDGN